MLNDPEVYEVRSYARYDCNTIYFDKPREVALTDKEQAREDARYAKACATYKLALDMYQQKLAQYEKTLSQYRVEYKKYLELEIAKLAGELEK